MPRKLNQNQLTVLELLYRFRFGTTALLANSLGLKNGTFINQRLRILTAQEYIGRKYDKSYKLAGKPATYYLLLKAFTELRKREDISASALKNMHKDKDASDKFIEHCLTVFKVSNHLETICNGRLDFFTKNELVGYEHFPKPLLDGLITLRTSDSPRARERHFFVSVIDSQTPFFVTVRLLTKYIEYGDSGDWESKMNTRLPRILLVCDTPALEKRLQKQGFRVEDETDNGLKFYTTTLDRLLGTAGFQDVVWQPLVRIPEKLVGLASI